MTSTVTEYIVIRHDSLLIFIEQVNMKLGEGWVLAGNIVVDGNDYIYQTMIKFQN